MIPARASYVATYHEWGKRYEFPVEAWDDDGLPLVFDAKESRLVRAADLDKSFDGVVEVPDQVRADVIPGGGWRVGRTLDDGTEDVLPVVAWVVALSGLAEPVIVADLGVLRARQVNVDDTNLRLIPPPDLGAPGTSG